MIKQLITAIGSCILSPPICAYCKHAVSAQADIFCQRCWMRVRAIPSVAVPINTTTIMSVHAVSDYQDPLKKLVLAKKWSDRVAARALGTCIVQRTNITRMAFDYIVPIPLHWTRFAYRGFNQAEEIARELSRATGKPVLHALRRDFRTPRQSQYDKAQRRANVHHVFSLRGDKNLVRARRIVLVDDVLTTGETMRSAASVLASAQPETIVAFVACRVV